MWPRKVITVPLAENSASRPSLLVAPMRIVAVVPFASAIWLATVRFQIKSYSANSSPTNSPATSAGVRKTSPAGRIASCASCAFLTLRS